MGSVGRRSWIEWGAHHDALPPVCEFLRLLEKVIDRSVRILIQGTCDDLLISRFVLGIDLGEYTAEELDQDLCVDPVRLVRKSALSVIPT